MSKQPIIGVTLDSEEAGGYSPYPWYALRKEYFRSISMLGGTPIALPHEPSLISHYFEIIDGLLLTGGDVDIPPEMYGKGDDISDKTIIKPDRTEFEIGITRKALAENMPILGICAGQQLLNVLLGGSLYQHIPDDVPDAQEHQQPTPRHTPWHRVNIKSDTLLHKITGIDVMEVNSNHHQAVRDVGQDVIINAIAPDGIIEGIEYEKHPFCLGVEWHPEHQISAADTAILKAFIDSSAAFR